MAGPAPADVLGRVTLVTGKEEFLNERTVAVGARRGPSATTPRPSSPRPAAPTSTLATLGELAAPSLFSTHPLRRGARPRGPARGVGRRPARLRRRAAEDVALVLVHGGGQKGSGVLTKLRKLGPVTESKSARAQGVGVPGLRRRRGARRHGGTIDQEAAGFLVQAVGQDLRSLAAAAHQLANDFPGEPLDGRAGQAVLRRPGRGQVVRGRRRRVLRAPRGRARGAALGARRRHRRRSWSPAPFAGSARGLARYKRRRARACARPTWPARSGCRRGSCARCATSPAAGPTPGIARAIRAVAQADADIKGAASDASYTLERLVLTVTALRALSADAPGNDAADPSRSLATGQRGARWLRARRPSWRSPTCGSRPGSCG